MRPFVSAILRWRVLHLAHKSNRLRRLKHRQLRTLARKFGDPFEDIPDREFVKTYRLGKEVVKMLICEMSWFMPEPRRSDGISVKLKVSR